MNSTTMLLTLTVIIIGYPFYVYYNLKQLKKALEQHWGKIETLVKKYHENKSKEAIEAIHRERRAYNSLVRKNNHVLEKSVGKLIAKKYGFSVKEQFEFTA